MKTHTIVVKEPSQAPRVELVETDANGLDLDTCQRLVGGQIERVRMPTGFDLWVNEYGKQKKLLPNFDLKTEGGFVVDCIVGPVFFARTDDKGRTLGLKPVDLLEIGKFFGVNGWYK